MSLVLNIAGSRETRAPGVRERVKDVTRLVLNPDFCPVGGGQGIGHTVAPCGKLCQPPLLAVLGGGGAQVRLRLQ